MKGVADMKHHKPYWLVITVAIAIVLTLGVPAAGYAAGSVKVPLSRVDAGTGTCIAPVATVGTVSASRRGDPAFVDVTISVSDPGYATGTGDIYILGNTSVGSVGTVTVDKNGRGRAKFSTNYYLPVTCTGGWRISFTLGGNQYQSGGMIGP